MMIEPNTTMHPDFGTRSIPSPRFGMIQLILFLLWGSLSLALQRDTSLPGLGYSGIYTLLLVSKTLFLGLWIYAGVVWLANRSTRLLLNSLEGAVWLLFAGLVLSIGLGVMGFAETIPMHQAQRALGQWTWDCWSSQGQLGGWTAIHGTLFPLNQINPPAPSLWTGLFLGMGLDPTKTGYALAVYGAYLLAVLLVYLPVRNQFGRGAALGLLMVGIVDAQNGLGFYRFLVEGDWGRGLGSALLLLAFSTACTANSPRSNGQMLAIALGIGLSVLCDPIFLFFHALWILLLLLHSAACWLGRSVAYDPKNENRLGLAFAVLLGLGLAAVYWLPLVWSGAGYPGSTRVMMDSHGLGALLVKGALFPHSIPWVTYLGMAGALWALVGKRRWGLLLSIYSLLLLYSQTNTGQALLFLLSEKGITLPNALLLDLAHLGLVILAAGMVSQGLRWLWVRTAMPTRFSQAGAWIWRWEAMPIAAFSRIALADGSRILVGLAAFALPVAVLGTSLGESVWRWTIHPLRDVPPSITLDAPFWVNQPEIQAWWDSLSSPSVEDPEPPSTDSLPIPDTGNGRMNRLALYLTLLSCVGVLGLIGFKRAWLESLRRSRVNGWLIKMETTGACLGTSAFVLFCSIYPLLTDQPALVEPALLYQGIGADWIGKEKLSPDGVTDLELELVFTIPEGATVKAIDLYSIDPAGQRVGIDHWTTREGWLWKIALIDSLGRRCNNQEGQVFLPQVAMQHLRLFVSNPNPGEPEPPFRLACTIEFQQGAPLTIQMSNVPQPEMPPIELTPEPVETEESMPVLTEPAESTTEPVEVMESVPGSAEWKEPATETETTTPLEDHLSEDSTNTEEHF